MDAFDQALAAEQGGVGVRIQRPTDQTFPQIGANIQPNYVGNANMHGVGAPVQQVQQLQEAPVKIAPTQYVAADNSYFGIGFNPALTSAGGNVLAAGALNQIITFLPDRPISPVRWLMPSTIFGLFINQIKIGGTTLLPSDNGIPVEFFSEVSTAPNIDWITINTTPGVQFTVSNPSGADLLFTGAFYGTQARQ